MYGGEALNKKKLNGEVWLDDWYGSSACWCGYPVETTVFDRVLRVLVAVDRRQSSIGTIRGKHTNKKKKKKGKRKEANGDLRNSRVE